MAESECSLLSKELLRTTRFKIILNILAHGSSENICDRTVRGAAFEVDYVNNFEKSNYVTKMNLFSIVPYGINTTSASCGYTSREMKHKLILGLYAELTKDMKTNIYNLIESHLHLNPKEKLALTFEQMEDRLVELYGVTIYDMIIDIIIDNLTGMYVHSSYSATSMAAYLKTPDLYSKFKKSISEGRNFIDPQIIVKESYAFSKILPTDFAKEEYSGIYGLCATYKPDTQAGQSEEVFKSIDFSKFDFTKVADLLEFGVWSVISSYIDNWNDYINTLYRVGSNEHFTNFIEFQRGEDGSIMMESGTPIRITHISNQSLYHIVFLCLNGVMDTPEFIEAATLLKSIKRTFFVDFLKYIGEHLKVDLYLISFACRGTLGSPDASSCVAINKELQRSQLRLKCKIDGFSHFRRFYIREAKNKKGGKTRKRRHRRYVNKNKSMKYKSMKYKSMKYKSMKYKSMKKHL